jgi:hypothetical protein
VAYTIYVALRIRSQNVYNPVLEDWVFYFVLPLAANITLLIAGIMARSDLRPSLFGVAAAVVMMLFIGIHNAWDTTTWHVFTKPQEDADKEVGK